MHFLVSMQVSQQAPTTVFYNHNGTVLEIEEQAYRRSGENQKALLSFSSHLERMAQLGEGWRAFYPAEAFSFLDDYLKEKLSSDLSEVAEDMWQSYGEWFDIGLESPQTGLLRVHFSPRPRKGIVFAEPIQITNITSSEIRDYAVGRLGLNYDYPLQQIAVYNNRFCPEVYGKKIDDLHARMKKTAYIFIPPIDGKVWPVGHRNFGIGLNIGSHGSSWASRGVRVAKNSS